MAIRIGLDLVTVAEVADAVDRHGEHYLARVFTPAEVAYCRGSTGLDATRLAARFAAKEATIKVLRTGVPWNEVEVVPGDGGWVELALHGSAARLAAEAGLSGFAVSLTHEGATAAATVTAELAPATPSEPVGVGAAEPGGTCR